MPTKQELAAKAQTTQAVVSRLENVSVRCSLETVVRLAEALDAVVEVRLTPREELLQPEALSQTSSAAPASPSMPCRSSTRKWSLRS